MKVIISLTKKDIRTIRDDCKKYGCGECPSEHICTEIFRYVDLPTPEDWTLKEVKAASGVKNGVRYNIKLTER